MKEQKQIIGICVGFVGMISTCVCIGLLGNYMFGGGLPSMIFGFVGGGIIGYLWTMQMMTYLRNNL
ncbi:MAG: hypothetical protein ACXABY_09005 [Candidatus Thorarchaeota archaeon]|jgi:hypothetical protein